MGNEGSVPQQGAEDVDEQLEYQARAPPSATNPPSLLSNNNGNTGTASSQNHSGGGGGNSGGGGKGRLMGSVFTRRGNAHNQNSTGIERTSESAHSYPPSHFGISGDNGNSVGQAAAVPMPGEELTFMGTDSTAAGGYYHHQQQQEYNGKTNNPYDQHHHQELPLVQQPIYMQQQQQQQQIHAQHVIPNQQYYEQEQQGVTDSDSSSQQQQHPHNVVVDRTQQAAHALGKKSRRAGAGLISSMRNLSLGFGGNSGQSPGRVPASSAARQQQVNEWETRWDEDEDDDEEEEEEEVEEEGKAQEGEPASYAAGQNAIRPPPPIHPQMRPDMDSGSASAASAAAAQISSPLPTTSVAYYQQPQKQQVPLVSPPSGTQHPPYAPTPPTQKVHLVTATPETPAPPPLPQHQGMDDDGVEWDTGMQEGDGQQLSDKPNVEQFLPLLRVLGKGSFGKVVLVQKRIGRETGSLFAMKILRKSHLVRRRQIERTRTERKVLSVVNHPFIMKLHYAFQSPDKLYLVLDYCPGGELFFHLSRFRRFPERVARFYSAELLLALGHLHKRGIIYRDLKPENVLLDADGHVKLGDFGLAKAGIRHAYEGATSMCGTPEYMAPEVLAQQGHGFCVDYWGLGMLTYEMMSGLPPWYTTDRAKLFRRLRSAPLDIPSYFSSASATFTGALLERNPRRRLGVTGIRAAMEHEFFKSISWRALYGRRVEAPIRPCEGWSPPEAINDQQQQQQQQSVSQPSSEQASTHTRNGNDIHPGDLDAATANFDNQFTRMPVESDHQGEPDDEEDLEELHEDTFVGFTFDDTDRDELEVAQQAQQQQRAQQQAQRQRTHHFQGNGNAGNGNQAQHHLD